MGAPSALLLYSRMASLNKHLLHSACKPSLAARPCTWYAVDQAVNHPRSGLQQRGVGIGSINTPTLHPWFFSVILSYHAKIISIDITWGFDTNADSQVLPTSDLLNQKLRVEGPAMCFNKPPRWFWNVLKSENLFYSLLEVSSAKPWEAAY